MQVLGPLALAPAKFACCSGEAPASLTHAAHQGLAQGVAAMAVCRNYLKRLPSPLRLLQVLGTFITEWDDGALRCMQMFISPESAEEVARQLASIVQHYRSEGCYLTSRT